MPAKEGRGSNAVHLPKNREKYVGTERELKLRFGIPVIGPNIEVIQRWNKRPEKARQPTVAALD